jgi:predicted ATPase
LNNLPAPLMQLIGRDEVISRVSAQLAHHRLITLVGPGGIGKTSVAIATAEGMTESYDHGVWFVDLTAISDPTLLAKALGSAIRLGHSVVRRVRSERSRRLQVAGKSRCRRSSTSAESSTGYCSP